MSRDSKQILDPDLNEEMLRMVKKAAEIAAQLHERKGQARPEPGEEGAGEAEEVGEGEEE
jgi:hypothetical protein